MVFGKCVVFGNSIDPKITVTACLFIGFLAIKILKAMNWQIA